VSISASWTNLRTTLSGRGVIDGDTADLWPLSARGFDRKSPGDSQGYVGFKQGDADFA